MSTSTGLTWFDFEDGWVGPTEWEFAFTMLTDDAVVAFAGVIDRDPFTDRRALRRLVVARKQLSEAIMGRDGEHDDQGRVRHLRLWSVNR